MLKPLCVAFAAITTTSLALAALDTAHTHETSAPAAETAAASAAPEGEIEIDVAAPPAVVPVSAEPQPARSTAAVRHGGMCFIAGTPAAAFQYTVIRKFKVGKGSYGGVKDILPQFAEHASNLGADAVMNYAGSQRFGFWPWRMVRPVVQGVAIKWHANPSPSCEALGGSTLAHILATDQAPQRQP